jgi:hypothetical protein
MSIRGVLKSDFVAWGAINKNQRVKHEKSVLHGRVPPRQAPQAPSPRACRRFHDLCASGTPANPHLSCQCLRASFLARAFARIDGGQDSCGGALAEVFDESATLTLSIRQANEPITTDSGEPTIAPMDQDAAPGGDAVACPARLAARSSAASSCR